ncbi:MAG TPA: HEAT repeat domain-containing protein [Tepidisphaeraceae bacterium]|nr:HEAT repeat domain-containing protein [Tepidisphaeraceae bacterium]
MKRFLQTSVLIFACSTRVASAIEPVDVDKVVAALAGSTSDKDATAAVLRVVRETGGDPKLRAHLEEKLVGLLEADGTTWEGRVRACQALWVVGGDRALGVLERMLADERDSHLACYAIGRMPSAQAGQALARGLGLAKGRAAVNILNTLGSRAEAGQVEAIAKRVRDPDAAVVEAALGALAKLGTPEAYPPINQARGRWRTADLALLEWAERAAALGNSEPARKAFEELMRPENDPVVRRGALAGLIGVGGERAGWAAARALTGNDPALARTAIAAMMRRPNLEMAQQVAEMNGADLARDREVVAVFLDALAGRVRTEADREVGHWVARLSTQWTDPLITPATARLFAKAGGVADVSQLLDWATTPESPRTAGIAVAARAALVQLGGGAETDRAMAGELAKADQPTRLTLIRVLSDRWATAAVPALAQSAKSDDPKSARAAIDAVGALGGPDQLGELLALTASAADEDVRRAAELAAIAVASRNPDPPTRAVPVVTAYRAEKSAVARASLARVLGGVGGPAALGVLKEALADGEPAVRDAALRALAGWADASAAPALLEVARQGDAKDVPRAIALRGALRQLGDAAGRGEKVDGFVEAAALVKSADEKRLLLAAVSNWKDGRAAGIVEKFLADPEVKEEAKLAMKKIGK